MLKPLYCCPEYLVDSDGYIISKRDNRRMKPCVNHHGYFATTLMIDGHRKTMQIHLAVARTFLGDRTAEGLVVNHKDGDKTNNNLENLEWVTIRENARHAVDALGKNFGKNNGNAKPIQGFDKKTGELKHSFESMSDGARAIALEYDLDFDQVKLQLWRVLSGNRKSYKGCVWKYV